MIPVGLASATPYLARLESRRDRRAEICGRHKDTNDAFCIRRVRLGLHVGDQTRSSVLETIARYPVGREFDVFYSPENRNDTTLESHSSWHELFTAMGLAIAFLMSAVFWWAFRKMVAGS
ncbi:MAG: DUF3592 domain-containing protein [Rhodocyclaceae bacterium]|nr:MAG: DUF3592 domain-containing protein [Rhodocyclaceae bacterium]